jgi:hypothetical protein
MTEIDGNGRLGRKVSNLSVREELHNNNFVSLHKPL